jgi:hypothetical protein
MPFNPLALPRKYQFSVDEYSTPFWQVCECDAFVGVSPVPADGIRGR